MSTYRCTYWPGTGLAKAALDPDTLRAAVATGEIQEKSYTFKTDYYKNAQRLTMLQIGHTSCSSR
jgi:hypothetical protein